MAKNKSKLYTDKKRRASKHDFNGDLVLLKQKRTRKDMSRFRDKPLVVTAVKESMISFNDKGNFFSRDASFFKFKTASTTKTQRESLDCSDTL